MSTDTLEVALLVTALAGGAVAVAAISDPALATAGGAVGLLAVLGLVAREATRSLGSSPAAAAPAPPDDPFASVRAAVAGSTVQRDRILGTLVRIDRARGVTAPTLSPEETARLGKIPPEEFRTWLRGEIERREAEF